MNETFKQRPFYGFLMSDAQQPSNLLLQNTFLRCKDCYVRTLLSLCWVPAVLTCFHPLSMLDAWAFQPSCEVYLRCDGVSGYRVLTASKETSLAMSAMEN